MERGDEFARACFPDVDFAVFRTNSDVVAGDGEGGTTMNVVDLQFWSGVSHDEFVVGGIEAANSVVTRRTEKTRAIRRELETSNDIRMTRRELGNGRSRAFGVPNPDL